MAIEAQINKLFAEIDRLDNRIEKLELNQAQTLKFKCPFKSCSLSYASKEALDQHIKSKGLH